MGSQEEFVAAIVNVLLAWKQLYGSQLWYVAFAALVVLFLENLPFNHHVALWTRTSPASVTQNLLQEVVFFNDGTLRREFCVNLCCAQEVLPKSEQRALDVVSALFGYHHFLWMYEKTKSPTTPPRTVLSILRLALSEVKCPIPAFVPDPSEFDQLQVGRFHLVQGVTAFPTPNIWFESAFTLTSKTLSDTSPGNVKLYRREVLQRFVGRVFPSCTQVQHSKCELSLRVQWTYSKKFECCPVHPPDGDQHLSNLLRCAFAGVEPTAFTLYYSVNDPERFQGRFPQVALDFGGMSRDNGSLWRASLQWPSNHSDNVLLAALAGWTMRQREAKAHGQPKLAAKLVDSSTVGAKNSRDSSPQTMSSPSRDHPGGNEPEPSDTPICLQHVAAWEDIIFHEQGRQVGEHTEETEPVEAISATLEPANSLEGATPIQCSDEGSLGQEVKPSEQTQQSQTPYTESEERSDPGMSAEEACGSAQDSRPATTPTTRTAGNATTDNALSPHEQVLCQLAVWGMRNMDCSLELLHSRWTKFVVDIQSHCVGVPTDFNPFPSLGDWKTVPCVSGVLDMILSFFANADAEANAAGTSEVTAISVRRLLRVLPQCYIAMVVLSAHKALESGVLCDRAAHSHTVDCSCPIKTFVVQKLEEIKGLETEALLEAWPIISEIVAEVGALYTLTDMISTVAQQGSQSVFSLTPSREGRAAIDIMSSVASLRCRRLLMSVCIVWT